MDGSAVRVGIVSFAHLHAASYASALNSLNGLADFVGVSDDDEARGREAAERYGVRFLSEKELLSEVEAVVVCTENVGHRRAVEAAVGGRVHVLCEKPIATTVEDAGAMIRAAREAGVRLGTAFPVRYVPAIREAKREVMAGSVGRVVGISGTNHGQNPGGWFTDPELSGGGAVMDHTVHVADVLRWMFGTEVESVYAEVGGFYGSGTDDAAILTLELANGVFATIDPSWSRGAGYPFWGDLTMTITGTRGVVDVDAFSPSLTVYKHDEPGTEQESLDEDMDRLMLGDFLRGIRDGEPRGASGVDGLRALEVALAAYRSGREKEPVSLERSVP
jgi:UDP-N-acetylglucosamine 3-dehydrogenase